MAFSQLLHIEYRTRPKKRVWYSGRFQMLASVLVLLLLLTSIVALSVGHPHLPKYSYVLQMGGFGSAEGQMTTPYDVAVDSQGNVYVSDTFNFRIEKFTGNGDFLLSWGSRGTAAGQFNYSMGLAVDKAGYVYVVDDCNSRIQKFTGEGVFVAQWGSRGSGDGEFVYPFDLTFDCSGNVYVVDSGNSRVQEFTNSGVFLRSFGSNGTGPGQFIYPHGVAIDASGNIYVSDYNESRIQKFDVNGNFLLQWGTGSGAGQLKNPNCIALDNSGLLYVADYRNNRIAEFTTNGTFLGAWGVLGSGSGQFDTPKGVAVDSKGDVYVADTDNNRVQKFHVENPLFAFMPLLGIRTVLEDWQLNLTPYPATSRADKTWNPGVATGDFFCYEMFGVYAFSNESLAADIPQFERNNTDWLRIEVTGVSGSIVNTTYTVHFKDGSESEVDWQTDVNPESRAYFNASRMGIPICASNLESGDSLPLVQLQVTGTSNQLYSSGERATVCVRWNFTGNWGTCTFDRQTGVLVELNRTYTLKISDVPFETVNKTDYLRLIGTNVWVVK